MENLTILIIDDEKKIRELLKEYINLIFPNKKHEIILCNSVKTGIEAVENYLPDLVFLDIEMPEANGFELLKNVNTDSFEVVFTTAYAEYMEKSINEYGCFGYILKPFDGNKLKMIFDRFEQKKLDTKYFKFINGIKNKRMLINLDEILYCKANDNYTNIFLKDAEYLISKTLREIEGRLPDKNFIRVHRSYLINLLQVDYFDRSKNRLILKIEGDDFENEIPVSASFKENVDKLFL
nr:LytTR family DNA-binding domain-containing protein [uncultured Flavobacterium sp.]